MIGRLSGVLVEREGHEVVIDAGGVGYQVVLSAHSLATLGPLGSRVVLRIYTHFIKSDFSITLYGFTTSAERQLFDLLITVKNVGPASAVKILSSSPGPTGPADLARLIAAGRASGLTGLRGVGKKTAEMLVVELRDRCADLLRSWGEPGAADQGEVLAADGDGTFGGTGSTSVRPPILEDVASALGQLGWRPSEVDKVVAHLAPAPDATFEGLLRQALRYMPR